MCNMSFSPNSVLVQRTIDLQYENKKRANSLKWSLINGVLFVVFVFDISCKCPNYTSPLHYVEYALTAVLGINLLQHGWRLLPRRSPPLTITSRQRELLGVADADTSFHIVDRTVLTTPKSTFDASEALSVSLTPRSWKNGEAGRRSASASPPELLHQSRLSYSPDRFIADSTSLLDYLKQYKERSLLDTSLDLNTSGPPVQMPVYQLASMDSENKLEESGSGERSGGLTCAPQVWWQLQLDPQRLTHWNLNLRLWLHVTIFERLVREMASIDETVARLGLIDMRLGQVSVERLRQSVTTLGGGSLVAVLPFLDAFPDQKYLVQRIKELAVGGCLSNYKWNGGGSDFDDSKPTDAEIILHLFATYLDGQMPGVVGGRPFSAAHVTTAPSPPKSGPNALGIHRVSARPPHYVLAMGDDTIEVCRGRNNLLHTILLLIAACARRCPPAINRVHLGPAGLNMLWIIS